MIDSDTTVNLQVSQMARRIYDAYLREENFGVLINCIYIAHGQLASLLGSVEATTHPIIQFLAHKIRNVAIPNGNDSSFQRVCNEIKHLGGL